MVKGLKKQYRKLCATAQDYKKGVVYEQYLKLELANYIENYLNCSLSDYQNNFYKNAKEVLNV